MHILMQYDQIAHYAIAPTDRRRNMLPHADFLPGNAKTYPTLEKKKEQAHTATTYVRDYAVHLAVRGITQRRAQYHPDYCGAYACDL